jgi:hypothetical protein
MTPATAAEKATHSITAYGTARSTISGTPLSAEDLRKTHAYWRACNYLTLGMIYLQDNPLAPRVKRRRRSVLERTESLAECARFEVTCSFSQAGTLFVF